MRRVLQLVALLLVGMPVSVTAQTVERIVATVNRRPLMASELDDELRFEALQKARPATSLSAEDAQAALDRLVEHELLRQQMQQFESVTGSEVEEAVRAIRERFPQAAGDDGWRQVAAQYGLSPEQVREMVAAQLQILHFIDFRLRPSVRVYRSEVEKYYRETLTAQLKAQGHEPEPLADVYGKIEEILTEQRMDDLLADWMNTLRVQSDVRIQWTPPATDARPK